MKLVSTVLNVLVIGVIGCGKGTTSTCPDSRGGGCPPCPPCPKCEKEKEKPAHSDWNYDQWNWLNGVKRDLALTTEEGKKVNKALQEFSNEEHMIVVARQDAYDSVPWARYAPCAVTMSAILEYVFDRAGLAKQRDIFTYHDKFASTYQVERMLYRMGWEFWPLSKYEVQVGVGLADDRADWDGYQMVSGHIYMAIKEVDSKVIIADNSIFREVYRWNETEGVWLPPGITPKEK
jgi:hypothetical protein